MPNSSQDETLIPFDDVHHQSPMHDVLVSLVDQLAGKWCRANPGEPAYLFYDEDFILTLTLDYQLAVDFSLRHPFYIVVFDRSMAVMHLRVAV